MERKASRELADRIKAVKAMEFLARQINDEEVLDLWLMCGVADEDIEYGDLSVPLDPSKAEDDGAYQYAEDEETFSDLMRVFLRVMSGAMKSGGLWCGGVESADE